MARRCWRRLGAALLLLVATDGPAGAVLLVSEDFAYAAGELDGQAGGSGFAGAWTAVTAPTGVVDPGTPLSYAVPGGGMVDGGSRALLVEGTSNSDNLLFRSLATPANADALYVGFLFQPRAGSFGDNDFAVWWQDGAASGTHTDVPNLGVKVNQGGGGASDLVARLALAGPAAYATNLVLGQTYYVVGRLSKSTPGAANVYDRFELWVDPSAVDPTPDASASFTGSRSSVAMLGMRTANLDADDDYLFDALRVGTAWSDVVPVPEPGSGALLALGLLALAGRRSLRS